MKTVPFLALFATLILTSSYVSTVIASPAETAVTLNDGFNHFRAHRQGNTIALSWASSTPGVTHFIVERSFDDGEFFDPIDQVTCSGAGTHKYNDAFASGGVMTYRVVAVTSDGTRLYSDNATVRIVQRK